MGRMRRIRPYIRRTGPVRVNGYERKPAYSAIDNESADEMDESGADRPDKAPLSLELW